MPKRVVRFVARLSEHEPFYVILLSGLAAFLWGIYSNLSPARLENNPIYAPLTAYVPGTCVEGASVILGMVQLAGMGEERPAWQGGIACVMAVWWGVPARMILDSASGAPAVVVYGVFGVLGNCIVVACYSTELLIALRQGALRIGAATRSLPSATRSLIRRVRGAP